MINIHATCIALGSKGILLTGSSGSGKSDSALRMIKGQGAVLVADDRTDIIFEKNKLIACCPAEIKGLLEVRGIGIIKLPPQEKTEVSLLVELVENPAAIERLPQSETAELCGVKIKKIKLYPFEMSAVYKLKLACDENS